MNRLRTLAGLALVGGLFAGLTSCANKKGDLGADLDSPPIVIAGGGAGKSVLDITSPADIPAGETVDLGGKAEAVNLAELKNRQPQSVSINREARISALSNSEAAIQKEISPVLEGAVKGLGQVRIEPKADPKADVKDEPAKPEVKKEVAAAPVLAPLVTPVFEAAAKAVAEVRSVPKADVKDGVKTEVKQEVVSVPVLAPAAQPALEGAALAVANIRIEVKAPVKAEEPQVETPAPVANAKPVNAAEPNVKWTPVNPADARAAAKAASINGGDPLATGNATLIADDDKNPPPPNETPEQKRARELLEQAAKTQSVQSQANRQAAEAAYQTGLRLFNDWEYEQAKSYFESALRLDPLHEAAAEKLRTVRTILNIDVSPIASIIKQLTDEQRAKMQERIIELSQALETARSYEARGSESTLETDSAGKVRTLSEQLLALQQARERYERIKAIIDYMPPSAEWPGMRRQAEEAITRVRGKIEKLTAEIDYNNRAIARESFENARSRETDLYRIRIIKMLEQVKALYDMQLYREAEQMAMRVLISDPMNEGAERWKNKARSAYHSLEKKRFNDDYHEDYRHSLLDVDEASISTAPLIQYPPNWDQISKRTDVSIGRKIAEDPWKADIRKKLQRKVSFEFVDTPLADAIEFLRHLASVTMIIDPKVIAASPPAINLRVTDMNLDLALEWILKLAELEYALQDNAIFISKPQTLLPQVEMRIYDVSDLTQNIQDFPGPEFQITVAGDKGAPGAGAGGGPFGGAQKPAAPTNATIQEMIKARIRPDTWDPAQGTSIEEKGGKLVVMQRPEVHKLIDQLLSNFRSTQKMMINIESRFLNIREAYLEQTGVEFQGLDPNVMFGDFGDLRRLGAPTGYIQPRVPGSGDTSPGNLPFPGFINGPDAINGGTFSQVGTIVNHFINFFPNEPETISARDTTNTVRQGGLSAQVTILNNAQVQAFIRALAVRENSSTLVAPRLTVFNTQRASMFVARQQSYVADYEISGDSYDPVIRQFLVGVVLDVKPIVSSDRRYVTLELRPTVTELVNFVTRQIDTFSVNSGAQVNVLVLLSFPIQFPELSIRRIRTTATVPDGGIMLVGGLYKNLKFNAENGVPFLSDLPVVGRMFRWNTVDNVKTNLAILVSPRIILFNEEEERLLDHPAPAPGPMYSFERKEDKEKCR